jgi:hypothetical protein
LLLPVIAAAAFAQSPSVEAAGQYRLRLVYPDGLAIQVHTQSSLQPPPSDRKVRDASVTMVSTLVVWRDGVHRVVIDKDSAIVFAYDLAVSHGAWPDSATIRIAPLSRAFEAALRSGALQVSMSGRDGKVPPGSIPTVSATREFPSVSKDQAVTLDILYNPTTNEKIFEVLIPVSASKGREL